MVSDGELDAAAELLAEATNAVVDAYASRDAGSVLRAEQAHAEALDRFEALLNERDRLREAEA